MNDENIKRLKDQFEEAVSNNKEPYKTPIIENPVYVQDERFPKVVENDYGIRPAGKPDECFYCHSKVGEHHKNDCVVVTKKVKVKFEIELELDEPHYWGKDNIEFRYNEGSWCSNNFLHLLEEAKQEHCLCGKLKATYVKVVDETPRVKER